MCNEYQRYVPLGVISKQFSELKIPLRFPEGLPNLAPTTIRIGEIGTIIRAASDTAGECELVQRRWSWPGPSGKPCSISAPKVASLRAAVPSCGRRSVRTPHDRKVGSIGKPWTDEFAIVDHEGTRSDRCAKGNGRE